MTESCRDIDPKFCAEAAIGGRRCPDGYCLAAEACPGSGTEIDWVSSYETRPCPVCGRRFGVRGGKLNRHKAKDQ
jgi:hypothetical protein